MRQLVAALACRVQSSRLYAKPLQKLDVEEGVTVLDHIVSLIRTIPQIDDVVLGIAEGPANQPFVDFAREAGLEFIIGGERDVLMRLIDCGRQAHGTDIFRVTTESPFFYHEAIGDAWKAHLESRNDVTTIDGLPMGCNFEIYAMKALEASHELGEARHRSEYCSLYIREHRSEFKVVVLPVPPYLERPDLRLTVDHPEDLVLCRRIYSHFKDKAPRIPLAEIIEFIDNHQELQALVSPFVVGERLW